MSLLSLQSPPPSAEQSWQEDPGHPLKSCVPTVMCSLYCQVGHGMDSRPAMAIFELLDYIVNEVCAPDLLLLLRELVAACPGVSWGRGCHGLLLQSPVKAIFISPGV